jgi:hypothetical protein
VTRAADELEVQDALERQRCALDEVHWLDEVGSITFAKTGVTLHLRKHECVFIAAVEFAVSGLPDGASYDGTLPYGIDGGDTLMDITRKLHPEMPMPGAEPHAFDAVFPEHRLVIRMDEDDMLQTLIWATTRDLRGPS